MPRPKTSRGVTDPGRDEPVSLAPLEFEQALKALLATPPADDAERPADEENAD